jgi:signal transduction histidine kinase
MFSVYACITGEHDLRLVALAVMICLLACYTAVSMLTRARAGEGARRSRWVAAAAIVFGAGVWATHFVAMLAFRPGLPVGYEIGLTGLSIAVAMAMSALGFAVALRHGSFVLGGVITGFAVVAMHYVGMRALIVPARIDWDPAFVAASAAIAVGAGALAMTILTDGARLGRRLGCVAALTVAIAGLHFTGMTAARLVPDPRLAPPVSVMAPGGLAIAVAAVTILIVALGLLGAIVDEHLANRATLEAERLRAYVADLERTKRALEATTGDLERALEAASASSQAKSQFLATMSHELRTPLNAILGFSQVIGNQMFGPLGNPRYADYVRIIHDSGQHLLAVINEILDFSKLDAGHLVLHEEVVDLSEVVDQSLKLVECHANDAGVTLHRDLADDLPALRADPHRVRQVLLNILSNAVKFTPRGGDVRVATGRRGDDLVVVVADSGIGMAAGDIPVALEPFRQIDNRLGRKYEGTGLGLPLAKRLAELHGGRLELASQIGHGTAVTIVFPGARCVQPAAIGGPPSRRIA